MRIRLPKPSQVLFFICVGVPMLNNYELTFAVWALAAAVTLCNRYALDLAKQIACFAATMAIAILGCLYYDYIAYYVVRDITYMVKPILGLLIGYQLARRNYPDTLRMLVYSGLAISVLHLLVLLISVPLHRAYNLNDLRLYGGYFSDFEVFAFVILLFHDKFGLGIPQRQRRIFTWIIGLSALSYFARTNMIQFVLLYLVLKGYFRLTRRSMAVVGALILVSAIAYSAIYISNPKRNGQGIEALLYKIKIAPTEPFRSRIDREDYKDFNDNYRSYENIMTVRQMTNEGWFPIIFGRGFGSRIDLRQKVYLGDMELRFISILHNGYMTVFLKSGLIGIGIYLLSIYLLFKRKASNVPLVRSVNLLLFGTALFLIFSNWVFMGVYNLLDNKSIVIGALLCFRELANRDPMLQSSGT